MTPEALTRLFKIADAYLLEYAKSILAWFIADQPDFEAEDTNFASPFNTNWETTIATAETHPSDEQRKDQLTQLTQDVLSEMSNCRDVFQGGKRYVKKAFPNSVEHWNEFGFDDYDAIQDSQPRMIQFMNRFHATAVKYTSELTAPAVNFPQGRIDEIETTKIALDKANNKQEVFKKDMLTFTRERVEALNAVWLICTDVAAVGKLIYKDNAAKYQRYLLPASQEPAGTLALTGTITDLTTGLPLEGASCQLQPHGLESETDSEGAYGFGIAPDGAATLHITLPGYADKSIAVIIDGDNPQVVDVTMETTP